MFVIKRNGNVEAMDFEKIHKRINWLVKEPYVLEHVNGTELTQRVIQGLKNNIKTSDIDIYASDLSSSLGTNNLEYLTLAGRIAINNHHKNTLNSFKDKVALLYRKKNKKGENCPSINGHFYKYVMKNQTSIDKHIDYTRDYFIDFFGFKTLQKGYLLSDGSSIVERPQDLFMRVAIQLYIPREVSAFKEKSILEKIFEVYDMMSQQYYTHATPTLFNSGKNNSQLSSCFLLGTEDSGDGIMKTLSDCAKISKWSGGIGIHISNWRSTGAYIRGTDGMSSGIVPFLRLFNDCARAFNQGGKRNGSFAIYLEPHHPDFIKFLDLKKSHGDENLRCRDLFLALWIPDLFMKRLESGERWSTFDPDECPGLNDVYGDEYEKLYLKYESSGMAKKTYDIYDILESIVDSQMEKGVPYIMFKDTVNRHSMQKNIGMIRSSNLCVSGDTLILTSDGYFPIKKLSLEHIPVHKIWNGEKWSEATFAKTGENKALLEIKLTNGETIKCTPQHQFITVDYTQREKIINANDLKIGDCLVSCNFYPVLDNGKIFADAYEKGFSYVDECKAKYVPINFSLQSKLLWLAGLFDSNGSAVAEDTGLSLCLSSASEEFLLNVKLLSNTLGINPTISNQKEGLYNLLFDIYDTYKLYKLELPTKKFQYNGHILPKKNEVPNKIKSIKKLKSLEDKINDKHNHFLEVSKQRQDALCQELRERARTRDALIETRQNISFSAVSVKNSTTV